MKKRSAIISLVIIIIGLVAFVLWYTYANYKQCQKIGGQYVYPYCNYEGGHFYGGLGVN